MSTELAPADPDVVSEGMLLVREAARKYRLGRDRLLALTNADVLPYPS